ncbi:hypothetical protein [Photobacterium profundum]|uniref:Lipoprotein n=1 Tax=Photobacterium profundum (strain SS9) TaxID=298386 RepID=Q6LR32_PHOPR|nr:hypothetical protein [Photobacterium profundum]CAG20244.1 conserved hypothetical protein [Photobacterium profundum SS9]
MDKLHRCLIAGAAIVALSGCSAKQSQQLGMRSNTVTKVSQQMSNLELCETYLYGRSTTQTHFAIASEWNRRGLSRKYCEETINQLYISAWASWLVANKDKKTTEDATKPVPLPATNL